MKKKHILRLLVGCAAITLLVIWGMFVKKTANKYDITTYDYSMHEFVDFGVASFKIDEAKVYTTDTFFYEYPELEKSFRVPGEENLTYVVYTVYVKTEAGNTDGDKSEESYVSIPSVITDDTSLIYGAFDHFLYEAMNPYGADFTGQKPVYVPVPFNTKGDLDIILKRKLKVELSAYPEAHRIFLDDVTDCTDMEMPDSYIAYKKQEQEKYEQALQRVEEAKEEVDEPVEDKVIYEPGETGSYDDFIITAKSLRVIDSVRDITGFTEEGYRAYGGYMEGYPQAVKEGRLGGCIMYEFIFEIKNDSDIEHEINMINFCHLYTNYEDDDRKIIPVGEVGYASCYSDIPKDGASISLLPGEKLEVVAGIFCIWSANVDEYPVNTDEGAIYYLIPNGELVKEVDARAPSNKYYKVILEE